MHAATSKEMVTTGDWILPRYNGEPFYDKPPLHNWLVALSFLVLGFSELAARLPAALLGLGTVLVVYWLGRRMYGEQAAFFGAAILATSPHLIALSRSVVHDSSLLFLVTLALTLFYRWYELERRSLFLPACAALGLAVLAKGLAGVVLPVGVVLCFLAARRDLRRLGRMPLGWGALVLLLVVVPWLVVVELWDPTYFLRFFGYIHIDRFLYASANHAHPWHYYLRTVLFELFPWSLFVPLAALSAWRGRGREEHGGTLLLLVWCGVYLLFFSLAKSKLSTYVLPMYPALALLIGKLWADLVTRRATTDIRRWSMLLSVLGALVPLAAVALLLLDGDLATMLREKYSLSLWLGGSPVFALGLGLGISSLLLLRGRTLASFGGIVVSIVATIGLLGAVFVPVRNPWETSRPFLAEIERRLPPGEGIPNLYRIRDSLLFYSDRPVRLLKSPDEVTELLSRREPAVIVLERRDYEALGLDAPILKESGKDLLIANDAGR